MKQIKFFATLFAVMLVMGVTSCSSDDDGSPAVAGLNDFYITVSASGGGLSAAELTAFETNMNSLLLEYSMYAYEVDDAVEEFDDLMEYMAYSYYDGMDGVKGTLKIVFTLKTTKGTLIKSSTLNITDETAWLS